MLHSEQVVGSVVKRFALVTLGLFLLLMLYLGFFNMLESVNIACLENKQNLGLMVSPHSASLWEELRKPSAILVFVIACLAIIIWWLRKESKEQAERERDMQRNDRLRNVLGNVLGMIATSLLTVGVCCALVVELSKNRVESSKVPFFYSLVNHKSSATWIVLVLILTLGVGLVGTTFSLVYFPDCWCYIFGGMGMCLLIESIWKRCHGRYRSRRFLSFEPGIEHIGTAELLTLIYVGIWGFMSFVLPFI